MPAAAIAEHPPLSAERAAPAGDPRAVGGDTHAESRGRNGPSWSAEDLGTHLGDIPLSRVRFDPLPGTATVEDAVRISETDTLCELIDGTLVEKAMGYWESNIGVELAALLRNFVREHRSGLIFGSDGMIQVRPGQVRMPDVAFYSWGRLPKDRRSACPAVSPDLAVEVISRGNTRREMARKRDEYFAAGTRLVWIVDPAARSVEVWSAATPAQAVTLGETDRLTGGDVLPGFEVALAELFTLPEAPAEAEGPTASPPSPPAGGETQP